jgi:hypothetical protein
MTHTPHPHHTQTKPEVKKFTRAGEQENKKLSKNT